MAAILRLFCVKLNAVFAQVLLLLAISVYSSHGVGCSFSRNWTGSWFQSGIQGLISINTTHIHSKGECVESESFDKFLLHDRTEGCYRCLVIHEKHPYVLQYKETYCFKKDTLSAICESISGDAPLYSMFRKEPRPLPQPCPFHPAPFTFIYNRGSGECANPPSKAESCTDESRMLLRYMACPDLTSSESNVDELVCLATWKEGSTRYLVGQITQWQRNSIVSDEDTYRCFVYKGQHNGKVATYDIAQSADATCSGMASATEGSRIMRLTSSDDEHNRCHFPSWIVDHHKWFSLDHSHQYRFTTKNATLKIMNSNGSFEEKRLVCHSILEQKDKKYIKFVAHVTTGCESGHMCVRVWERAGGVLELARGERLWDAPRDACAPADHRLARVTLITTTLTPTRCPIFGQYTVVGSLANRRRRRQQDDMESLDGTGSECESGAYSRAAAGCGGGQDTIELKSDCNTQVYTCHGSWRNSGAGAAAGGWVVVSGGAGSSRGQPRALCLAYTTLVANESLGAGVGAGAVVSLRAARSCDGRPDAAYNLTLNGPCEQSSEYSSGARRRGAGLVVALSAALLARR